MPSSFNQNTGTVTISNVPAGSYILGIKYDPTTLKGFTPPTVSTTYTFTVFGGVSQVAASVGVTKK